MTIAVFCSATCRPSVETALGRGVRFYSEWAQFEREASRAQVLVVVTERLADHHGALDVARLRSANPLARIVVVTQPDPDNFMLLPAARPDEAVLLDRMDVDGKLSEAIRRADAGLRTRFADSVRASSLSAWLARALIAALDADPPFASVKAWCRGIACVPGTLRYHFAEERFAGGMVKPKDFLAVVLLLFALDSDPSARTWYLLGKVAGVDGRRLRRTASRLVESIKRPVDLDSAILGSTVSLWLAGHPAKLQFQDRADAI